MGSGGGGGEYRIGGDKKVVRSVGSPRREGGVLSDVCI